MTNIEWTQETWNPIIGCSKISPGCENCYAEKMACRLASIPNTEGYTKVVDEGKWFGNTHFVKSALQKPLKRKKPTMYFVCSMGDLFHETVEDKWIAAVWDMMAQTPQHTYQILTKRPERMSEFISEYGHFNYGVLPNVWLGVTAENQEQANKRIPILLQTPAAIRFVSIEPMLSNMNISEWLHDSNCTREIRELSGCICYKPREVCIDWVICGGESGPNARPMHPDWVRSIRDQCKEANVPFFFKQWGEWIEHPFNKVQKCSNFGHYGKNQSSVRKFHYGSQCNPEVYHGLIVNMSKVGKKKAGSLLDGVEYKEYPKSAMS